MKTLEQLADEGELITNFESELVKQQLFDVIKEAAIENRIGRQLVEVARLTHGNALDYILADKDSMEFRKIAEGALIPLDHESYTKVTVTPVKWGTRIVVANELQEDANWDVIKRNIRQAGREAGVREDFIIFTAFQDSTNGFQSETGGLANHQFAAAGTELSIADIVKGMATIEEHSYQPNVMALHPNQVKELRQIDTFTEADKVGSRVTFEKGFVGKIFGMDVVVSPTVWNNQTSTEYAYILDSREAGVLVIRKPLTMKTYEIPDRDAVGVAVTFRAEARVLRAQAGAEITIS
jgi:HK97 family phage major capsid protein